MSQPAVGRAGLLLELGADGLEGPLLVGELAGFELGVEQFAIDAQLKASAACRDQFQVPDLLFVGGQQFTRQTDGLRFVISHRAVFQFQVHGSLLFFEPSATSQTRRFAVFRDEVTDCSLLMVIHYTLVY
jgi:hypothetical protein